MRHLSRLVVLLAALASPASAQIDAGATAPPAPSELVHARVASITLRAGSSGEARVELTVAGGVAPGAGADSAGRAGATRARSADSSAMGGVAPGESTGTVSLARGGAPLPPSGPAGLADNPIARGGIVAVLWLFGIGLALNLTPCVYPMLGVT